jgi:PAS domain S-box-containing protein
MSDKSKSHGAAPAEAPHPADLRASRPCDACPPETQPGQLGLSPPQSSFLLGTLEKISIGLALVDAQDRIVFLNERARAILGYGLREIKDVRAWLERAIPDPGLRLRAGRVWSRDRLCAQTTRRFYARAQDGGQRFIEIRQQAWEQGSRLITINDLTKRRRTEEALRESEAKFRTLTETAECGIFIIQGQKFIYMNPAGERITGRKAAQLYAMEFWEVVHPDYRELVRSRGLARQRGEQVPNHYEFKLVRPDGSEYWVDFTAGYVDYQGGPAMLGTAFDITERKQAVESLRLDEERLEALVRLGQMQDSPGPEIIDFALEQAVKLTRSDTGQLAFLHQGEAAAQTRSWPRGDPRQITLPGYPAATGALPAGQTELFGEAGTGQRQVVVNVAPTELTAGARRMSVPVLDGGRVEAVAAVAGKGAPYDEADARQVALLMDTMWKILQHQNAQAALRQSEERFRSVAENAPDIIYTLDREGTLTYVNPAWERILGHTQAEVLGRHYIEFARPEDVLTMVRVFKRIRDERQTVAGVEGLLLGRDGKARHFVMSGGPNLDPAGRVTGMVGLLKDITGQMELEAQLRHAQKMEAVGTLAGGVAHEFNNALMAIRGYVQLLGLSAQTGANSSELLAKIDQSCQRAADLTGKMLTFTRLEAGEKAAVDLNQVAEGVWEVIRQTVPPHIELRLKLEPGLPPVLGNAQQLEQVILNLVLNARDATHTGGEITLASGRVEFDAEAVESKPWARPGAYLTLEVSDTGEGMSPEVAARVFDPFFTTKEPGRGTGLGLAVAYSILKGHGGHIQAQSVPGLGSRFTVYLPLGQTPAPKAMDEAPAEEPPTGRGETILVVDDEPQLREIASEMLRAFGYRAEAAANGLEALEAYQDALGRGRPPALVLLDLAMPVMDGHECLGRLALLHPEAKVLVTTGHGGNQGEDGFPCQNARGVLRKPYNLMQLLSQVRRVLDD